MVAAKDNTVVASVTRLCDQYNRAVARHSGVVVVPQGCGQAKVSSQAAVLHHGMASGMSSKSRVT
jgi:hypothetical protein